MSRRRVPSSTETTSQPQRCAFCGDLHLVGHCALARKLVDEAYAAEAASSRRE